MHNAFIHGLVTRDSSDRRMPLKPLRCAGLYKTEGACVSSPEVVTKPSPYTLGAFCLAITNTPQSGLANGPEWAALKIHRHRYTPLCSSSLSSRDVANCFRQSGDKAVNRKENRSLLGYLDSCDAGIGIQGDRDNPFHPLCSLWGQESW